MMAISPALLLCALSSQPGPALELAAKWHEAGRCELAAALYDRLAPPPGQPRGEFYLAQGNAHFLAGHLAEAIRAYRRADQLLYRDARVQANLAEARSLVVDAPRDRGWQLSTRPEENWISAAVVYLLAWVALACWLQRPTRRRLLLAVVLFASFLGVFALVVRESLQARRQPFAVVADAEVLLRRGNGDSYAPVMAADTRVRVLRGTEVTVRTSRANGWLQVELPSGVVGWLPRDAVLLDFEPESLAQNPAGL
jgi:hypothetical protein